METEHLTGAVNVSNWAALVFVISSFKIFSKESSILQCSWRVTISRSGYIDI